MSVRTELARLRVAVVTAIDTYRSSRSLSASAYMTSDAITRRKKFEELWERYDSTIFESDAWTSFKANYGLYRQTRALFNPVRRLVNTYASTVYPGVLTTDDSASIDGVQIAIPFNDNIDPRLALALVQLFQWANWQEGKSLYVRYGSLFGSVLVEILDIFTRGRISFEVWRPSFVSDVELDAAGNVKEYFIEYWAENDTTTVTGTVIRRYLYGRRVTGLEIIEYRDGIEIGRIENPYGFAPAVWVRHNNTGGTWGAPAIDGTLSKIDQLNSLASMVVDAAAKKTRAPFVVFSESPVERLADKQKKDASSEASDKGMSERESLPYWWSADPAGHVEGVGPTIMLDEAYPMMDKLIEEIEQDHPELTLWRALREMSTVTGPGAAYLVGDGAALVIEAAANYDQQLVKLLQMAVAIAGWRTRNGWQLPLTSQQQVFLGFDLNSYWRGDLDFTIKPRPIIPKPLRDTMLDLTQMGSAITALTGAGLPLVTVLRDYMNWSPERIAIMLADKQSQAAFDDQIMFEQNNGAGPLPLDAGGTTSAAV